jgi:hypothetical protein
MNLTEQKEQEIKQGLRYNYDALSEFDYMLFDQTRSMYPELYALNIRPIKNNWANYQLSLAKILLVGVEDERANRAQFEREVWSTELYASEAQASMLPLRVISLLQSCDIDYPVELTYQLGGLVYTYPP